MHAAISWDDSEFTTSWSMFINFSRPVWRQRPCYLFSTIEYFPLDIWVRKRLFLNQLRIILSIDGTLLSKIQLSHSLIRAMQDVRKVSSIPFTAYALLHELINDSRLHRWYWCIQKGKYYWNHAAMNWKL